MRGPLKISVTIINLSLASNDRVFCLFYHMHHIVHIHKTNDMYVNIQYVGNLIIFDFSNAPGEGFEPPFPPKITGAGAGSNGNGREASYPLVCMYIYIYIYMYIDRYVQLHRIVYLIYIYIYIYKTTQVSSRGVIQETGKGRGEGRWGGRAGCGRPRERTEPTNLRVLGF